MDTIVVVIGRNPPVQLYPTIQAKPELHPLPSEQNSCQSCMIWRKETEINDHSSALFLICPLIMPNWTETYTVGTYSPGKLSVVYEMSIHVFPTVPSPTTTHLMGLPEAIWEKKNSKIFVNHLFLHAILKVERDWAINRFQKYWCSIYTNNLKLVSSFRINLCSAGQRRVIPGHVSFSHLYEWMYAMEKENFN